MLKDIVEEMGGCKYLLGDMKQCKMEQVFDIVLRRNDKKYFMRVKCAVGHNRLFAIRSPEDDD
jgi:hypothetical protein